MATTLNDIQIGIAADFDSSASPPATTNSEWTRRLVLINRYEKKWAQEMSYRWIELYKETTLQTSANVSTVTLPTDFKNGNLALAESGELKIGDSYYMLVKASQVFSYSGGALICWITGNPESGYTLNISPTPTEVKNIPFKYYSTNLAVDDDGSTEKEKLVDSGDFTKCPDPDYLIYSVLAQLYKDDDEGIKGQDFERLAINAINNMIALETGGQQNESNEIPDLYERAGYPMTGR